MARLPRLTLAGSPHHVIHRGHNGQAIVRDDADRRMLLDVIASASRESGVAVHAYVLLESQFQLLATPRDARGLPALMQSVGRRYVRYFNDRTHRTGTLWEGRYRSTVVQPERYLLDCMVAIDLAPVLSGAAADPAAWPWSSHRFYVGLAPDRIVTPDPLYWALGNTPFAREKAYAERVAAGLRPELQRAITDATLRGWALGDAQFVAHLSDTTLRRAAPKPAGRPRKRVA